MCIIKSTESVGGPTSKLGESKWSKLGVGWLILELREFYKKNPTFNFKIPSKDHRLPPVNYSGKNPARSMSSSGGKGKGGNQSRGGGGRGRGHGGFGGWMLPESPVLGLPSPYHLDLYSFSGRSHFPLSNIHWQAALRASRKGVGRAVAFRL